MRHFENTWTEAEGLVETKPSAERIEYIKSILDKIPESPELLGEVLFEIAGLSKLYNINVDAALQLIINDFKVDHYD